MTVNELISILEEARDVGRNEELFVSHNTIHGEHLEISHWLYIGKDMKVIVVKTNDD